MDGPFDDFKLLYGHNKLKTKHIFSQMYLGVRTMEEENCCDVGKKWNRNFRLKEVKWRKLLMAQVLRNLENIFKNKHQSNPNSEMVCQLQ